MLVVHMIGNAHIDPVWLWPWQAGVDEALATFKSAADRCDEYPRFVFTRGEAWLYDQVEQIDPELFERVKRHVASGQWHVTGGQWIQPDVNLPTLAGLRRQIVHGRRYFESRFGVRPSVGYNVDSFGHPATLPDILAAEGYVGYVFHRPNQKQTPLPQSTFVWRGPGGGEVLGYRIPKPYVTRTHDLYGQIMLAADAADPAVGHIMCFYGVGNHGGGPTKANIEYVLEHERAFDGIELRFSTPDAFFEAVNAKRDLLPTVDIELQRTFPGCYSVMGDVKREQHRGEHRLEQAVAAVDVFAEPAEQPALHDKLDAAWQDLLFTEFHDILAGTSIDAAWPAVRGFQGRARVAAEEVTTLVTRRWAKRALPAVNEQQIVLVNPNDAAFSGLVQHEAFLDFDQWRGRWVSDAEGRPVDFQLVQPQSTIMLTPALLLAAEVEAKSATVLLVRDGPAPDGGGVETDLSADAPTLSNARVRLAVNERGIASLDLDGRPALGDGGVTLQLREDTADTWGFHIDRFAEPVEERAGGLEWRVEEGGPLRARLVSEFRMGHSAFRWTLSLHRGEPLVRVLLEVDFGERYRVLQMPVSLASPPGGWRASLAGGAVDRDCSPVEWPMHGWGRGVPGEGVGLAVITPDAYSASLDGEALTWSLLRSPRMAWSGKVVAEPYGGRDFFTDQGRHALEFLIVPGTGEELSDARLNGLALDMVRPPIVFDRYEGMNRPPWGDDPPRRMWTGAEQRARRDGRMTHLVDDGGDSVEEPAQTEVE